jgi:endo-1,4-beta-xylanase
MKMEYIVQDDGSFRWDAPDRLAAFAKTNGMRLYGTSLVWYDQKPPAFQRLDGQGQAFADAYRHYILTVVSRYRGAAGWDVVNEAVNEDGSGLREHLWSKNLGADDHMIRAFEHAHEADPEAVLFVNEYFLEKIPRKRLEYMRLIERLLKAGAKLGGIGVQSHLDVDLPKGASRAAIQELATFGLPIHLSELDISLRGDAKVDLRGRAEKFDIQARIAREVAEAYADLPPRQRFAFSVWGLRDKDSWLRHPPNDGDGTDSPLLLDDAGQPKAMFDAVAGALKARP